MSRIAVVPGSFDPVTLGHLDVIERAAGLFDELHVVVVHNPGNTALLPIAQRVSLIQESIREAGLPASILVTSWSVGLLVDYCTDVGAIALVKGIRSQIDVAYETPMAIGQSRPRRCRDGVPAARSSPRSRVQFSGASGCGPRRGCRFAYMPSLGFCIAIILLLTKFMQPNIGKNTTSLMGLLKDNNKLTLVMIVVLSLFSIKTISRNMDWEYNLKLLAKDVQTCPESARIHYAYGSALIIEKGLKEETDIPAKNKYLQVGIEELQKRVELVPTYNDAWYHMAIAYKELKDNPNALRCFEKARNEKYSKDAEFLVAPISRGHGPVSLVYVRHHN